MATIKVAGMSCGHCSNAVSEALKKANAENVNVELEKGLVHWEGSLEAQEVKDIIEVLGFTVVPD